MELEHVATEDELMEETEILYKGMREFIVKTKVDEVLETVEKSGLSFYLLDFKRKGRAIVISVG